MSASLNCELTIYYDKQMFFITKGKVLLIDAYLFKTILKGQVIHFSYAL